MLEPIIISASRVSDIPAFYLRWLTDKFKFFNFINKRNPYNGKIEVISLKKVRLIVFWTKNPQEYQDKLLFFDKKGINYYFQYTLNDYEKEKLEPGLPGLDERIENFIKLSKSIGKGKIIWRFDPLILGQGLTVDILLNRIKNIGEKINPFSEKLVISFVDIEKYKKVKKRMKDFREFTEEEMKEFAEKLHRLNEKWNLKIATCAEKIDLGKFDIQHNKCIDDELIIRLFKNDKILMDYVKAENKNREKVYKKLKDKGQRKECGCIKSKDIGTYGSCQYNCIYCYARR